jgi:ribosome-binding ATPase YchF (GTP1/OBG family)
VIDARRHIPIGGALMALCAVALVAVIAALVIEGRPTSTTTTTTTFEDLPVATVVPPEQTVVPEETAAPSGGVVSAQEADAVLRAYVDAYNAEDPDALTALMTTDVVRAHGDEHVIHPEGRVDPAADIETIETELIYADLEQAERRHARVVRTARSGDKTAVAEEEWLRRVIEALQSGQPARTVPVPDAAPNALRDLSPLTGKPVLFVANVDEGDDAVPSAIADHAAAQGAAAVAISSRIEAEFSELDEEEAALMREEMGVGESGLERVVHGAFGLLDLIAFFTAGEDKPAQSWHLRRGLTAWHAAGEIHSDIQRGFVRAEVIAWDALVDAGGYAAARDRGVLRLEGRDYPMADGDVITVKFTP